MARPIEWEGEKKEQAKEIIIQGLYEGLSLKEILDNNELTPDRSTVYTWLNSAHKDYDEEFFGKYKDITVSSRAQQSKQCNANPIGSRATNQNDYRIKNASKTNRKRFPISSIYIMQIIGTNYYKIGVSQNIRRRHRDIESAMPFKVKIINVKEVKNPYDLEDIIHNKFMEKYIKSEWFELNKKDEVYIISFIENWR